MGKLYLRNENKKQHYDRVAKIRITLFDDMGNKVSYVSQHYLTASSLDKILLALTQTFQDHAFKRILKEVTNFDRRRRTFLYWINLCRKKLDRYSTEIFTYR